MICDTDEVLYASGEGRKEINRKPLSAAIEKILKDRRSYLANASEGGDVVPLTSGEDVPLTAQVIVPIVSAATVSARWRFYRPKRAAKIRKAARSNSANSPPTFWQISSIERRRRVSVPYI